MAGSVVVAKENSLGRKGTNWAKAFHYDSTYSPFLSALALV